MTKQLILKI